LLSGASILFALLITSTASTAAAARERRAGESRNWCPRVLRPCPLKLSRPHGLFAGLNEEWQVRTDKLSYADAIGARTIRFPLTWATVESSPGRWDWSVYDRLFAAARANGVGVILTPTDSPCWAHPSLGCTGGTDRAAQPPDRNFNDAWQEFIRQVVGRYPDLTGLEVWNEPNSSPFWSPSPDPQRYTELLRLAYVASKSVRPDIPVLFGGLAPNTGSWPGQMDDLEFLRRAYAAGAAAYFNALAIHPYPMPFSRPDYRQRTLRLIAAARRVVWRRQRIRMPIWVTEIGISTDGPGRVSDPVQARRLVKLYQLLGRVPDLPVVVVHRLFDQPGSGGNENGWGLVRANLAEKPAYWTMRGAFARFNHLPRTPPGSWNPPGQGSSGSGGFLPVQLPSLGLGL
jgi:polysaccharide biosynthesis protein PslG